MTLIKRREWLNFQKVSRQLILVFVLVIATIFARAQTTIYGPNAVNLNETKQYYNTLSNSFDWYEWSVVSGQKLSESENYLTAKWIYGGSQGVYFDAEDNWNYYWGDLDVTVSCSAPSAPTSKNASSIGSTSFQAGWYSSAGANSYRLDVSTSSSFSSFVSGYNNLHVGNVTSKVVSNLSCGATYYYRVRAVSNSCGTSSNSSWKSVSTTLPKPEEKQATNETHVSFKAEWEAVSCATSYLLDVSTSNLFTSYLSVYHDLNVGNSTSRTVTAPSCDTYYYRVRAVNSTGMSDYSKWEDGTTLPGAPGIEYGNNITNASFNARWDPVSCATEYRLDVSTHQFFLHYVSGYQNRNVGNVSSFPVTGLSCNTKYYYRVRAVNSTGTGPHQSFPYNNAVTLSNKPTVGNPSSKTTSSFVANWSGTCGNSYFLHFYNINSQVGIATIFAGDVGSDLSKEFTGLDAYTTYYYKVYSKNQIGNGSGYSNRKTVKLLPLAPATGSFSYVSWQAFSIHKPSTHSSITSLRLDVSDDNFNTNLSGYDDCSFTGGNKWVTGLDPSTTYKYRLRAVNSGGTSPNSSEVSVTTTCVGCRTSSTARDVENIEDLESYDITELYPNPVKENVNIVVSKDDLLKRLDVHDLAGKLLFQQTNLELQNTKYQLDLKQLRSGTYIITGYSDTDQIFNQKILKE